MRSHSAPEAMQHRERFVLSVQLETHLQRHRLSPQEEQESPESGPTERSLIDLLLAIWRDVTDDTALGRHRLLIRLTILLQIITRQR